MTEPNLSNLQEIFPSYAYSGASLRRILWYLFTRHGKTLNTVIIIKLMVATTLIMLQHTFPESVSKHLHLLFYGIIWLTVLSISLICCYIYIQLIYNFRLELLYQQCQRVGAIFVLQLMVAMLCLGILSTYTLYQMVQQVDTQIQQKELSTILKALFYISTFARLLQRILATLFISLTLPITKKWVDGLNKNAKALLLELLPWKIFLFFHLNFMYYTFLGESFHPFHAFEDTLYIISIAFRCFSTLWLLFMVLYVGYDFAIPWKCDIQSQGPTKMAGTLPVALVYPLKSNLVIGLSARFHASRHSKVFPSAGEEREKRARMRINSIHHDRYRIQLSELM